MLHVFHVDLGTIYTFQMELAMESVQVLMSTVASVTGIPEDKQVLLISNGEALDPTERVCSYSSAGTDTNPIFLFSKSTIESSIPPSPSLNLGSEENLKEQVEKSFNLPPTYETLVSRAQLASDFHSLAVEIAESCESLVYEQKLQQKGWAAVVANLESIASEFEARSSSVHQIYSEFLDSRTRYIELLDRFKQMLPLLARVPVLPCLMTRQLSKDKQQSAVSLLDWISAQDNKNTLQDMVKQCIEAVEQFDESHLTEITAEVREVLESLDNTNMKEIKGLDERLAGLQQILQNVQTLTQSQDDMSKGFQQNQARAQNIGDPSVLPDLCASHQKQLMMLLKNHSHLRDIRKKCARAKDELSANLHTRLRWIMYVEKKICDCDGTIIMYHENIRRIKRRLEIIEQVNEAPRVYILAVAEVVRRRSFSSQFQKWASKLCESSVQARTEETARREEFELHIGQHFLQSLFSGLSDRPTRFAEKPPRPFDEQLPIITDRDLQELMDQIPELASYLESSSINISMKDESGKTSFLQSEELENLSSDTHFPAIFVRRTSENVTDKKVTSSVTNMSSSESKATQMSMDASTQVEWTCSESDSIPIQESQGSSELDCTKNVPDINEQANLIRQETTEGSDYNESNERKKSNSDTASEKSSALDDSDLVFRSAHEDYVTVFDADLAGDLEEKELPPDIQPVGEIQEDCAALLDDASQTPTLASSGTQSTDHSTQTECSSDSSWPVQETGLEEFGEKTTPDSSQQSFETTGQSVTNEMVKRLEQLEEQLRTTEGSLEKVNSQKEKLQQLSTQVKHCVKGEFEVLRQCLNDSKQLILEWDSKIKEDVLAALGNLQQKGDLFREQITQNVTERTKGEFQRELMQLNSQFEQEKSSFLEMKSKLEFEKGEILNELKQVQAEKERSETQHREENEKLSLIVSECKAKLEEHEGAAQKVQESKSRYEEDQQIRFNAIMMKLKREKEHAVLQAQEKIKELRQLVEQQENDMKSLVMEKDRITGDYEQAREAFCGREQELLAVLQEKESKILEAEILMQNKEAAFLEQIEQEKASTLALLQVERQMWEAERSKNLVVKVQETECATDAVLEEDYQQRIQFLEEENRKLTEQLSEQTAGDSSDLQGGHLKRALDEKDQQIKILQHQLSQMQQLAGATAATSKMDKISLRDFQSGDLILLVFDERYENYLVLSNGQTLFFLHPDSMAGLDLATSGPKRRPWMLAQMTDKEYCQAKKPHNRFHVPVGTKFYRIQAKPCQR
ncbi:hypothetical protein ACROYT_G043024 [Oculina patagonica]